MIWTSGSHRVLAARVQHTSVSAAVVAAFLFAAPAMGQIGTGTLTLEASRDGITWTRGEFDLARNYAPVRIRMLAEWSAGAGYAFAGTQGDIFITNSGAADSVSDLVRPGSFATGAPQTIVASRFGSTIKIDDSRDTRPPGEGARGIFPGQMAENFAGTNFTRGQPVSIFEFTFTPDASGSTRLFRFFEITPSGAPDVPPRFMRIYTSPAGAQNAPNSFFNGLRIVDIPAPGATALLGLVALGIADRRRR